MPPTSRGKRGREPVRDSKIKSTPNTDQFFSTNVILSGAHFDLFNDLYGAQLDLNELARHIWGCEITTHETIANESASLKDFIKPTSNPTHLGSFRSASAGAKRSQQQQSLLSLAGGSDFGQTGEGTVLRIRFPRTIAFRERFVDDKTIDEADDGQALVEDSKPTSAPTASGAELLTSDDLPQLSLLSSLHHAEGFASQSHYASATPIFASTAFGTTGGVDGSNLTTAPPPTHNAFNLSSNIMQSTLFGAGGGVFGGIGSQLPPSTHGTMPPRVGGGSGLSELYQSILSSDVHGGGSSASGGERKARQSNEASVDDLLAFTVAPQRAGEGSAAAGGDSLFGMAARFHTAKIDSGFPANTTSGEAQLLGVEDLVEEKPDKPRGKVVLERIVFDSVFCTVTRRGGVTVFGPIPPVELPAVSQMVHEYLSRAILTSCPWCVSLSATLLSASARKLVPISPKEMITCGSAAEWNAQVRRRLERLVSKRRHFEETRKLQSDREEALVAAAFADDSDVAVGSDGFAMPLAPGRKKVSTLSNVSVAADSLEEASDFEGADVISLRLQRLRSLLSLPETHATASVPGLLPKPSLSTPPTLLSDWLDTVTSKEALVGEHGFRVTNIMCHLAWTPTACAKFAELRGEGSRGTRPKHLTVTEFENFIANVGRWSLMRESTSQIRQTKKKDEGTKHAAHTSGGMKHPDSASFSSSRDSKDKRASVFDAAEESDWLPKGVTVVCASSHDFCRFEWHFDGRAVEVVVQRRSATFRIVVAHEIDDCDYVSNTLVPLCLNLVNCVIFQ